MNIKSIFKSIHPSNPSILLDTWSSKIDSLKHQTLSLITNLTYKHNYCNRQ